MCRRKRGRPDATPTGTGGLPHFDSGRHQRCLRLTTTWTTVSRAQSPDSAQINQISAVTDHDRINSLCIPIGGYANNHDCRVSCDLRSVDRRGAGRRPWGVHRLGRATDRGPTVAGHEADGGHAQFAQACQDSASGIVDACGPKSPALTGWSGASPHVLRFPLRAFLRFPVCPPGSSPSPAVLWFPFVRRSPVRSLRPLPGSGSPSVSLRFPSPWAIFTLALPRGGSPGVGPGRQGPTSPVLPRPPRLDRAIRLHDGWAAAGHDGMPPQNRLLRAAESPVTSGRERRTSPHPNCPDRPLLTRTCGLSSVRNVT